MSEEFVGKMDALDLVIKALKEHEKRLDDVVNRLEANCREYGCLAVRERMLSMNLSVAIVKFQGEDLVLFEVREREKLVKVMVPRGTEERYVVDLVYDDDQEREHIVDALMGAVFIQQETRITPEW